MKFTRILSLVLALALIFTGCDLGLVPVETDGTGSSESTGATENTGTGESTATTPTQGTEPAGTTGATESTQNTTPPTIPGGIEIEDEPQIDDATQAVIYSQLFDLDNKIELSLHMSDAELRKMQQDHERYSNMGSKSPIYRMADLEITITTADGSETYHIPEVGVRMKGNTSRTSFYNSDEGIYNYIHLKLSFQETFDDEAYYGSDAKVWTDDAQRKARKDRTFATLEKLDMRWNKNMDNTYIKETYAYEFYREQGVLAPHTNLCSFDWSGVHMGVYTINEPVDKIFLAKYLPAEELGGDLYKGGWTHTGASFTSTESIGIEDEDNGRFYAFDLKTNKKTSDHSALKNLITQLNSGSMNKERLAELVDMGNFLSYAAVSYFLGNPDDLRHNYNNFYIYFLQSSGKAIIIPYDYDRCLGINRDWNPSRDGMTGENPFSDKRELDGEPRQDNPLFRYTVCTGGYYIREYALVLEKAAQSTMLLPETFARYYSKAEANYKNDVQPSKHLHNGGDRDYSFNLNKTSSHFDSGDNISFADYITAKLKTFNNHMAKLDQYANAKPPVVANYYIRGEMNGWNVDDHYAMTEENGVFVYDVSSGGRIKLKVYDKSRDAWYGTANMDDTTTVPYESEGRDNIILKPGKYTIIFNPETLIITVTEQQ